VLIVWQVNLKPSALKKRTKRRSALYQIREAVAQLGRYRPDF